MMPNIITYQSMSKYCGHQGFSTLLINEPIGNLVFYVGIVFIEKEVMSTVRKLDDSCCNYVSIINLTFDL